MFKFFNLIVLYNNQHAFDSLHLLTYMGALVADFIQHS